jgi:hypothetical protein
MFLLILNFVSARHLNCDDNPTQLWHFDEGNGTIASDICGGINATLYGDTVWVNGEYGNAIQFNGMNTYVDAGNIFPFNQNMPEFSFSLWVNFSDPNISAWQTLFRSGYYVPYSEFIEAIQINEGDGNNYALFMASTSNQIKIIDDSKWHNIIGTFNGTSQNSTLYIDGDFIFEAFVGIPEITSTTSPLYFGFNFDNGFLLNGTLDEIAFFNRTLTQEEITNFYNNATCPSTQQLITYSYPYVDFNTSYFIQYETFFNNSLSYFGYYKMDITDINSTSTFNFNWSNSTSTYDLELLFSEIGDYPFVIYNPMCLNNFTGTFMVRHPYYVTVNAFISKENSTFWHTNKYINNFAYLTAEFTDGRSYNNDLEPFFNQFTNPINSVFQRPVFYAPYIDGSATIKLYENSTYALRFIDGQIIFPYTFSIPNITKSYGTNIYLGTFLLNQNDTYNIYLNKKDINPIGWLADYILLIGIIFAIAISIFLFFIIPSMPLLSIIFGIGFTMLLIILRVVIWLFIG